MREFTIRPTVATGERSRWDALRNAHQYVAVRGLVGRNMRQVEVLNEHWLALIGWHPGPFKLKVRDRQIEWLPEQQIRRLHLIANNARFPILPGCAAANLASRVVGLNVRRLSDNFRAAHGHPVLIAESFVDRSLVFGTCYRAANGQALGQTRGIARKPGAVATRLPQCRPKEVLVYPLVRDARERLRRLVDPGAHPRMARLPHRQVGACVERKRRTEKTSADLPGQGQTVPSDAPLRNTERLRGLAGMPPEFAERGRTSTVRLRRHPSSSSQNPVRRSE